MLLIGNVDNSKNSAKLDQEKKSLETMKAGVQVMRFGWGYVSLPSKVNYIS